MSVNSIYDLLRYLSRQLKDKDTLIALHDYLLIEEATIQLLKCESVDLSLLLKRWIGFKGRKAIYDFDRRINNDVKRFYPGN